MLNKKTVLRCSPFLVLLAHSTSLALSSQQFQAAESITPVYAEICAGSQHHEVGSAKPGGVYGHAFLYLKGACRDSSAPLPALRICDDGPGVGVSTNMGFKNVAWVAVEGRDFMFSGGQPSDALITKDSIDMVIQKARAAGVLKNVQFHESALGAPIPGRDLEYLKYRESVGTDFAISFARNSDCLRIPMSRESMGRVVTQLNKQNSEYFYGGKTYNWNPVGNNCAHTVHNAIAATGAWEPKETDVSKLRILTRLSNVAIPLNTIISAVEHAYQEVPSYRAFRFSNDKMASLGEQGWMLPQVGSLVIHYPAFKKNLAYHVSAQPVPYETHKTSFATTEAELAKERSFTKEHAFQQMKANPAVTDLRTHLQWSRARFATAIAEAKLERRADATEQAWFNRYMAYLHEQIAAADRGLAELRQ